MNFFSTRAPGEPMAIAPYRIDAVLFDFDGTLTRPGALDFSVIKRAIGCPDGIPVLEFLAGIDDPAQRLDKARQLDRFELDGAAKSQPNTGAEHRFLSWLTLFSRPKPRTRQEVLLMDLSLMPAFPQQC